MDFNEPGMSIADMVRQAACEVYHSRVPPGFEWVPGYGQYYSRECGYFYDPNTGLFYDTASQVYYVFNDTTQQYEIYKCMQDVSWKNERYEEWAKQKFGEEVQRMTQDSVDCCETLLRVVDAVAEFLPLADFLKESKKYYYNKGKKKKKVKEDSRQEIMPSRQIGPAFIPTEDPNLIIYDPHANHEQEPYANSSSDECSDEEDERIRMMNDERYTEPPCLRIIVNEKALFIVTISGGYIGKNRNADVFIDLPSIPEKLAEFLYVDESNGFVIRKVAHRGKVIVNDFTIDEGEDVEIQHGDVIHIAMFSLSIHVHYGHNTCPGCEPGLLKTAAPVNKYVRGETARRRTLKMLKAAYGFGESEASNTAAKPRYEDRAARRRREVGSDAPKIDRNVKRPGDPNDMYANCQAKPVPGAVIPEQEAKKAQNSKIGVKNKGFKLLQSMGWKEGEGLGKANTGRVEPVINQMKSDRAGLGAPESKKSRPQPSSQKDAILDMTRKRFEEISRAEKR